ncbi:hypothetical protein Purlil1_4638 [Purpureocillium lilacinum]|uniref:Uncharacterized protein n=1 Tax=Purpureocillium lilacinum TaxID=33203 RepID=A0ABR0C514_PURLI|nr:hypothetical protein Purlil1_4638 [Purpureocillium lilacinum]
MGPGPGRRVGCLTPDRAITAAGCYLSECYHDVYQARAAVLTAGPAQRTPSFVGQRTHDGLALPSAFLFLPFPLVDAARFTLASAAVSAPAPLPCLRPLALPLGWMAGWLCLVVLVFLVKPSLSVQIGTPRRRLLGIFQVCSLLFVAHYKRSKRPCVRVSRCSFAGLDRKDQVVVVVVVVAVREPGPPILPTYFQPLPPSSAQLDTRRAIVLAVERGPADLVP